MHAVLIHRSGWQLQQLPIAGPLYGVLLDGHVHGRPAAVEFASDISHDVHSHSHDKLYCRAATVIVRVPMDTRAIRTCAVPRRVRALGHFVGAGPSSEGCGDITFKGKLPFEAPCV